MNKKIKIIFYQIMIVISVIMIGISVFFLFFYSNTNKSVKVKKEVSINNIKTTKGICDVIEYNPTNNSNIEKPVVSTKELFNDFTNRRITSDWTILLPKLNADKKTFKYYTLRKSGVNYKISFIESCYSFKWDSSDGIDYSGDFEKDLREVYDIKVSSTWQKAKTNFKKINPDTYLVSYSEEIVNQENYNYISTQYVYLKPNDNPEQVYGLTVSVSNAIPSPVPITTGVDKVANEIVKFILKNISKNT